MNRDLKSKLIAIGFTPYSAINVELPSRIFLSAIPAARTDTDILVFRGSSKDFVVIFPHLGEGKWRMECYGKTETIKNEVLQIGKEVF